MLIFYIHIKINIEKRIFLITISNMASRKSRSRKPQSQTASLNGVRMSDVIK